MEAKKSYTLSDVWYAAQHHRQFNYAFWMDILLQIIYSHFMVILGNVLVVMALVLITGLGYGGLVFVVPALVAPGSILHLTLSFLGVWFLFCIYFNYLFAVFTPAGSPPLPAQDQDQPEQGETERVTAGYRTCKKCSAEKPPRCHHCSQCGSCTLKFDHHCPWINNCVGLNNYRYFVSFLFWTALGTLYLSLLCMPTVYSGTQAAVESLGQGVHHQINGHLTSTSISGAASGSGRKAFGVEAVGGDPLYARSHDSPVDEFMRGEAAQSEAEQLPPPRLHGMAAMVEGFQMFKMLLLNSPKARREQNASEKARRPEQAHAQAHGRRAEARPEPGADLGVPVLPVFPERRGGGRVEQKQHLRGSGGLDTHRPFSPLDLVLRPGVFNKVVSLFPMEQACVLVIFVVAMSVHIGVAVLFFFHAYLVATAQTTLEFNINMHKAERGGQEDAGRAGSVYDRGSLRENFIEVFGPPPLGVMALALLPSTRPVHNSGGGSGEPGDYCQPTDHFNRSRARIDTGYGNLLDV